MKKTQLLLLGRKGRAHELQDIRVTLSGERLPRSEKVKCLGIWIDDGLTWREHIQALRRKCFCGLAKLRRLRDVLPMTTKKKIYNALVLPHLDCCSVVWQECAKDLQRKLEQIQNYGMRLILSKPPRTPSADLRKILKWVPLTERRKQSRLALVHRCINKHGPAYMRNVFRTNEEAGCRTTRGLKKLHLFQVKTELGKKSFWFKGSQEWNSLPEDVRNVQETDNFKKRIRQWSRNQLLCDC